MKCFSDKGAPKLRPDFSGEFADDFFALDDEYVKAEIAGGAITKRTIDSCTDFSAFENLKR